MITIVGAGPAGCLIAILLARRGQQVEVFEKRADPRSAQPEAGRSINLALAARGIRALREAGVLDSIADLTVTMRGRALHETGEAVRFSAYGQRTQEVIHSISRAALTARLTETARAEPNIRLYFSTACTGYEGDGALRLRPGGGREYLHRAQRVIGTDGAGSVLRAGLASALGFTVDEQRLDHDYKELVIPVRNGTPALAMHALHIWPRGGFMLIALPNADGSFTATLFLPRSGDPGFVRLTTAEAVEAFFAREFPDVRALIPDLARQFFHHPQGLLGTVHCPKWNDGERLLLLGDAAHAMVPFHGQGMNCAFEDCRILDALMDSQPREAFAAFAATRPPDTEAIAAMALENYLEMRDTVREPRFARQHALALQLERRHPGHFIPRYSMVMFHDGIPYSVARERGRLQQEILDRLVPPDAQETPVDWALADRLIADGLPDLPVGD